MLLFEVVLHQPYRKVKYVERPSVPIATPTPLQVQGSMDRHRDCQMPWTNTQRAPYLTAVRDWQFCLILVWILQWFYWCFVPENFLKSKTDTPNNQSVDITRHLLRRERSLLWQAAWSWCRLSLTAE